MGALTILLIIIAVIAVMAIGIYNSLIQLRNRCENSWAQVDVQLKRRYDLIPNLVETVKGYATHEKEVFLKVTEARTSAMNAGTVKDQGMAENQLSGALKTLFAVAESYPDLKANKNFIELQNELVELEDHLQYARRFYNGSVRVLNTRIETVPDMIVAQLFRFRPADFFAAENRDAPTVKL